MQSATRQLPGSGGLYGLAGVLVASIPATPATAAQTGPDISKTAAKDGGSAQYRQGAPMPRYSSSGTSVVPGVIRSV